MMRSWLAVALLTLGCASASEDQLRARAAYDMECKQDRLYIIELDDRTRGVQGCGQKATYVESCDGVRSNLLTECTWVLNTDSRRTSQRASAQ